MSIKTPPISPTRGSINQFFSNNESYEENLSLLNDLNSKRDAFSDVKSTSISRNLFSGGQTDNQNSRHLQKIKDKDLMPTLASVKSDSRLGNLHSKELSLMPVISKPSVQEIKMRNNFNKNKF